MPMSFLSSRKRQNGLAILASALVILSSAIGIFRFLRARSKTTIGPEKAIKKVFQGTKYQSLIPYIVAQAKHETGGFNVNVSRPFAENNNMFGMQRPRIRETTDNRKGNLITEGQVMANYDSLEDSAKDFYLWLEQWKKSPFPTQVDSTWHYASELKGADKGRLNYYTDHIENYSNGLARWL